MINYRKRRLAIIALLGAFFFAWLLYLSATASTTMLLRLWHDQDGTGTVSTGDIPAEGVEVTVTPLTCGGDTCDASLVVTDTGGYASLELQPGTSYEIAAPCMAMAVATSDVSGQAAQDMTTCALSRLWLPVVAR